MVHRPQHLDRWVMALLILCAVYMPGLSQAMSNFTFGTCSHWNNRPNGQNSQTIVDLYHLGIVQGFVMGLQSKPIPYVEADSNPSPRFVDMYSRGYDAISEKPDLLAKAFDSKCGDYKNANVRLIDLGLIVMLEIGGAKNKQSEQALEVYRSVADEGFNAHLNATRQVVQIFQGDN